MTYADKSLICRHCGTVFVFTAFEQEFYVLNQCTHVIECCRACRKARRTPNLPVFLRPAEPRPGPRAMCDATCLVCGTTIDVSFTPCVGRPIYCAECSEHYGSPDASRLPDPIRRAVLAPRAR